jgi:ADP-heptose:LPS heptosyltransferase
LLQVGGVRYVSLQKLDAVSNAQPMQHPNLVDLTARFADFADTAAVIANLDLIISVDTAVAHLAGAMGKPTWLLLKAVPDWRWMMSRSDSPWYPTMRLFRQPVPGDWAWVIDDAAEQLRGHVHSVGADPS